MARMPCCTTSRAALLSCWMWGLTASACGQSEVVRNTEPRDVFSVIQSDLPAELFAADPLRRTSEILQDAQLNDVSAVGNNAWAVGSRGQICRSSDGGSTWTTTALPFDCQLSSVRFLTDRLGWVAGWKYETGILPGCPRAVLLRTRDGGATWESCGGRENGGPPHQAALSDLPGILNLHCFGLEDLIAVTLVDPALGAHSLFRSRDGGSSWESVPTDQPSAVWNTAAFMNSDEGVTGGVGQALGSVVSGEAVVLQPPRDSLREIRALSVRPDGIGWAVGDGAFLLKTQDGGVTWSRPGSSLATEVVDLVDLHSVASSGDLVLLAGNPGSCIFHSLDGGLSWTTIPLPGTGVIRRLIATDDGFLAVGGMGRILRSDRSGQRWSCVRGEGLRAAVLVLSTAADGAADRILSAMCADAGYRSVVVQPTVRLEPSRAAWRHQQLVRHAGSLSRLAVSDFTCDWMFPLSQELPDTTHAGLIASWMRQTDGQLARLLPLRLARSICDMKPVAIVVEQSPAGESVSQVLHEALLPALKIAAEGTNAALTGTALKPWRVELLCRRTDSEARSPDAFEDHEILTSLRTTTGLACDAGDSLRTIQPGQLPMPALSSYLAVRTLEFAGENSSIQRVLSEHAGRSVRRVPRTMPGSERASAAEILRRLRTEAAAFAGAEVLALSEEAFVGQLTQIAEDLPAALAMQQLAELSELCRVRGNLEGLLAANREIIRRFPTSRAAVLAARDLLLHYGSAEIRHFRTATSPVLPTQQPLAIPSGPGIGRPQQGAVAASPFGNNTGTQSEALTESLDRQYDTAWRLLLRNSGSAAAMARVFPEEVLASAALFRSRGQQGAVLNRLSLLTTRQDLIGQQARAEMNLVQGLTQNLMTVIRVSGTATKPVLDARLVDDVWATAAEIPLVQRERGSGAGEKPSTFCFLAYDREYLYLAAVIRKTTVGGTIRKVTARRWDDNHGSNERLTLQIDTDRDYRSSFMFTVDETGRTSDRCGPFERWNPEWFVATENDSSAWRLEVAIPLSQLTRKPVNPGEEWVVRIDRILPGEHSDQIAGEATTAAPESGFGLIRFGQIPSVATP